MSVPEKIVEISTKKNAISVNGNLLLTRSRSLIVFICVLLAKKRSNIDIFSVTIAELRSNLPSVHGKQMQRFIDALANIAFPIGFESKTRGRYWLTAPLDQVQIDIGDAELMAFVSERKDVNPHAVQFTESFSPATSRERRLMPRVVMNLDDSALTSIGRLVLADLQFHDGNLDNDIDHAYDILRKEVKSATPEFKAIALLKLATVCLRLNRYTEAQESLRGLRAMVHSGEVAAGNFDHQIKLQMAMLRFVQGRVTEAQAIFETVDLIAFSDDWLKCQHCRLAGLLLWHKTVTAYQKESRIAPPEDTGPVMDALADVVALHQRSLQLSMNINNYDAMQRSCLDIGNVHLDAYRLAFSIPDQDRFLEQGINWVTQCEFICSKFGIGMSSVKSKILLMSVAVDSDLKMCNLNQRTDGLFKNFANFDVMADFTLGEARRIGNTFEQAAVLTILATLASAKGDVQNCAQFQQQAMDIYKKQNRPDMCRQLKKKFEPTGGKLVAGIFA